MSLLSAHSPSTHDLRIALERSGYGELRQIGFNVEESRVRLTGRVSSYFLKQLAQTSVQRVPGVQDVRNELTVTRTAAASPKSSASL